jgi:hypothetical protein
MTNRKMNKNETYGTLLKHNGGMYAYIVERTDTGYIVQYSGNKTCRLEALFSEANEWEVLREGYGK